MKNPIEENREVNQGTEKYKLPRKKITKSQEEMWNLTGNKKKMQTKTIMEYNFSPCKLPKFNEKFEKYQIFPPN